MKVLVVPLLFLGLSLSQCHAFLLTGFASGILKTAPPGGKLHVRNAALVKTCMQAAPTIIDRRKFGQIAVGGAAVAAAKIYSGGGSYAGSPDLTGKVAIISGGNTGIGFETAERLASLGAQVVLACRSDKRGSLAARELRQRCGPDCKVDNMQLNLASQASIEAFAAAFKANFSKLDILEHMGVNHMGHFHLTNLLMPHILTAARATGDARIVQVSSLAHTVAVNGVNLEDIGAEKDGSYSPFGAYAQSKLANILFISELQRRLPADSGVTAMSVHPGIARTELGRYYFIPSFACEAAGTYACSGAADPVALLALPAALPLLFFFKSPRQAAQTQIRCAADPELRGPAGAGKYLSECVPQTPSPLALDTQAAAALWRVSEQVTGRRFDPAAAATAGV